MVTRIAAGLIALTCLVSGLQTVRADIMIVPGPGNVPGDENVLFNEGSLVGTGNPVQGITNTSGFVVNFLGLETLTTPAAGQARITAETGTFDDLTISLDVLNGVFTSLIFNLNADADGQATVDVTEPDASVTSLTFDIDENGENFVVITAINGQSMSSVHISSTAQLEDIRQIRIGGAVPEPASLALVGCLALVGVPYGIYRRRQATKA